MADYLACQRDDPRYPAPLSAAELRAFYRRNHSPEVRALLWEIARLQTIVRRADQLLSCFPASAGASTATALDIVIGALRRELKGERAWKRSAGVRRKWSGRPSWPRRIRGSISARPGAAAIAEEGGGGAIRLSSAPWTASHLRAGSGPDCRVDCHEPSVAPEPWRAAIAAWTAGRSAGFTK